MNKKSVSKEGQSHVFQTCQLGQDMLILDLCFCVGQGYSAAKGVLIAR